MTRFFALCSVFLVVSGLGAVSALAAPPPAEAFGKRPLISDVSMSPDGTHYAALQWINGKKTLVVFNMYAKTPSEQVRKMTLDIEGGVEEKVETLSWLNNETLGLVYEFEGTRGGTPVLETRLGAVKKDLSKMWQVPHPIKHATWPTQFQHRILDYIDDDPEHILMPLDREGRGWQRKVYKVKISNGTIAKIVTDGDQKVGRYLVDQQGQVRLGVSGSRDGPVVYYREQGKSRWRVLYEANDDEELEFWPIAFASDPNRLFVGRTSKKGFDEVLEYDMVSRSIVRQVFALPGVDIDGIARDHYTRQVTGFHYARDYARMEYIDSDLYNIQTTLDRLLPDTQNWITSYDRARSMFIVKSSSPKHPGTYYMYLRNGNRVVKLFDSNAVALNPLDLGEMKRINYTARDGTTIPAYLTTPPHGEAPFPLVVMPHGGPTARDYLGWDHWVQFLASRGYAVLQPNFRGSTGFGDAYMKAGFRQWGLLMQDDVTDGARAMIDQGIANPERMCIVGGSYGGYAALMGAVVTPDLFQCAVSFAGVSNIDKLIAQGKRYQGFNENPPNVGSRRDDRDQLRDTSPINNIDAIKIPILLVHGDRDLSVDILQSKWMAKALKKAGKPYKFVIFKEGNHHLELERHRLSFLREMESFLEEHIGN